MADLSALSDEELLALYESDSAPKTVKSNYKAGIGRTMLDQGMQGATFGFADEITDRLGAGIAALATDESYGDLLDEARGMSKERMAAQMKQRPVLSIGSNLIGGVATGVAGAGTKGGTALANWVSRGGLPLRVLKGGAIGAGSGGVYGFGAGEGDIENRLESMGEGAAIGTVGGAAIPIVGAAIRKVVGKPIESGATAISRKIATNSGEITRPELSKPMQKVYDRLRADFPDDVEFQSALNKYFSAKEGTLLQAGGKRTTGLGEGSAMYQSGGAKAGEFFDKAVDAAPEKLKQTLAKTVNPNVSYTDALDEIVKVGRAKAAPVYKMAYQKNQSVQSPVIDRILQTPEGKSALREAAADMQNEMSLVAKPDKELTALVKELADLDMAETTGSGMARGLKLQTLDYVKRAMDKTYRKAIRAGDEGEAGRILNLKKGLVAEIDGLDKSGLYAKARRVSGDYLSNRDALEEGRNIFKQDREIVDKFYKGLGKSEREAYRIGVVKQAREMIDSAADGRNVAAMFGKKTTRDKLQSILKPEEYERLLKDAEAIDGIYKLRNQLTGGSRTAMRQLAAEEFDDMGQQVAASIAQRGFTRTAIDQSVAWMARRFDGLNDKLAGDVMDILLETDPKKKYQIVKQLTNQMRNSDSGIRKTEAANKLKAFYSMSDAVNNARVPLAPVSGGIAATKANDSPPVIESKGIPAPIQIQKRPEEMTDEELLQIYNQGQTQLDGGSAGTDRLSAIPADIRQHEGLRLASYDDTTGNRTVGFGFNMDSGIAPRVWKQAGIDVPFKDVYNGRAGITDGQAEMLGRVSTQIAYDDALSTYPALPKLSPSRQRALVNLSYQMGKPNLSEFKQFNAAVNNGKWTDAARFLLKSKYATEQAPNRAKDVARMLLRDS